MHMTKIFKHVCNCMTDQSQTSWKGYKSLYKWSRQLDQNGRNGYKQQTKKKQNKKKKQKKKNSMFFFRTSGPLILKLGIKHLPSFDLNHDTGMTLTYFTTRSTSVAHASENTNWDNLPQSAKGRYQGVTWKITCADQSSIVSHRLRCARCPILTPEGQLPI